MLQADCEELRQRLEEKNRLIEKKTQQAQQERQRAATEIAELREHMDIKDRKINVLQRKVTVVLLALYSIIIDAVEFTDSMYILGVLVYKFNILTVSVRVYFFIRRFFPLVIR